MHNITTTVPPFPESTDYVPMYMLVICAMLLGAATLGLLGNLTLMAATLWHQKSRRWKYGLHYSIIIANAGLGSMWLPSHMAQIIINYGGHDFPSAGCLANRALFHLCFVAVVTATPFLVIYELCRWSSPTSRSFVDASRKQFVLGGIIAAWSGGIIAATCVVADYNYYPDDRMCRQALPWRSSMETPHSFTSVTTSVLALLGGATILLLLLMVVVQHRRRMSSSKPKTHCYSNEQCVNGSDLTDDKDVQGHLLSTLAGRDNNDGVDSFDSKTIDVHKSPNVAASNASSDEDDDSFDMKMRLRMQKKAGGGRRHTVANIGLQSSPLGGPGGSSDTTTSRRPNYGYVRKWSVDITALQNQLENPKIHTSTSLMSQGSKTGLQNLGLKNDVLQRISAPQGNKRSAQTNGDKNTTIGALKNFRVPAITFNTTEDTDNANAAANKDSDTASGGKDSVTAGSGKDNITASGKDAGGSEKDSITAGSGKDSIAASSGKDTDIAGSVTSSVTGDSDIDTVNTTMDKDNETTCVKVSKDNRSADMDARESHAAGSGEDQHTTACDSKDSVTGLGNKDTLTAGSSRRGIIAGNGRVQARTTDQRPKRGSTRRAKSRKILLLTLAVNACMLPYIVTQLLVGLLGIRVTWGMCHLTAVISVIQIPLQPLLFAWMNRGLRNAVTQLWRHVSQSRCVCYCHVGSGTRSCCGQTASKYQHQSVTTVCQ